MCQFVQRHNAGDGDCGQMVRRSDRGSGRGHLGRTDAALLLKC